MSGHRGPGPRAATDVAWMDEAACRGSDPDLWFPAKGGSATDTRRAKEICRRCPVRAECLAYAVRHGERWGVWGGLTERERRAVRQGRGMRAERFTDGRK